MDLLTDEKMATGLTPDRARREALIEIGGMEQVKEEVRAVRAGALLEQLAQDARYAIRGLRRARGFTATVIATLALGIGANTAIFSVIDALLFRPLPVDNPEQLAAVYRGPSGDQAAFSYPEFSDLAAQTQVLAGAAAWGTHTGWMRAGADLERVNVHLVSANYFSVLGVAPQRGRSFSADDDAASTLMVVLSDRTWRTRFNADPSAVGRSVTLSGQVMTIAGVAPASFVGLDPATPADAWITFGTLALIEPEWDFRAAGEIWLHLIVRVRDGISVAAAESGLHGGGQPNFARPEGRAYAATVAARAGARVERTLRSRRARQFLPTRDAGCRGVGARAPDRVCERRQPPGRACRIAPA